MYMIALVIVALVVVIVVVVVVVVVVEGTLQTSNTCLGFLWFH